MNPFSWIAAAGILGFAVSAFFSESLKLSRRLFLIPYISLTTVFLVTFFITNDAMVADTSRNSLIWSLIIGALVSVFLVRNVFSQPASQKFRGTGLVFDIAWAGIAYGVTDALFLNVMPVMAVWMLLPNRTSSVISAIGAGFAALAASLFVTFTYHVGYSEFRNKSVLLVLFGNTLITLPFIISSNPAGAILSHTVMHIAAVIRGPETTIQLPPHRNTMA